MKTAIFRNRIKGSKSSNFSIRKCGNTTSIYSNNQLYSKTCGKKDFSFQKKTTSSQNQFKSNNLFQIQKNAHQQNIFPLSKSRKSIALLTKQIILMTDIKKFSSLVPFQSPQILFQKKSSFINHKNAHQQTIRFFSDDGESSFLKNRIPRGWEHFPKPGLGEIERKTPNKPSEKGSSENHPSEKNEPSKNESPNSGNAPSSPPEDPENEKKDKKKKKRKEKKSGFQQMFPDQDLGKKNEKKEEEVSFVHSLGPIAGLGVASLLLMATINSALWEDTTNWSNLIQGIKDHTINRIVIGQRDRNSNFAAIETLDGKSKMLKIGTSDGFERHLEQIQTSLNIEEKDWIPITYTMSGILTSLISALIPISIFGLWWIFGPKIGGAIGRDGGGSDRLNPFQAGKSKAKLWNQYNKVTTTFDDVAGLHEVKVEVQEFVDFLKNPKKYRALGAKIPKGALIVGPPGTGKTLLAKATAGEANVPFFSTSGSDFVEMFVGVGPARVRDLFKQARKHAPCIIFIDEIDAIGRSRSSSNMSNANDERENTLNQILVEMDGFTPLTGIVVLAGTNRPDVLDSALTRPGRFDRQIALDNPDISSRVEIFLVHMKPLKLHPNVNVKELAERLAKLTPGFSGADIANTCNEAALICARYNEPAIEIKHFENAIDRVVGGLEKKTKLLSPEEKKTVAYHESGHATVSWFLDFADPLLKITIVPRGRAALGYAQYLPEERFLHTEEEMNDMMVVALGGRVAEELIFGTFTTGARDDLDKVTRIAYSQVQTYGMNKNIGSLSFKNDGSLKKFSDYTAEIMDEEVRKLIQKAYERCKSILFEQREGLEKVAQLLLEKEVLSGDDLEAVFGKKRKAIPVELKEEYLYKKKIEEQE